MIKNSLRYAFVALTLLLGWQFIVWYGKIQPYLLPSPLQVFTTLYQQCDVIMIQALPTLLEICLGLLLGIILGCSSGLLMTFFSPLRFWFWPLLIISQAIPTFTIAPLLVMWLGFGLASKISTTVLMVFFPITSAFYDGLNNKSLNAWWELAKTMNANPWRFFWYIRIPAALPALASGIRIATVAAPIGAVVGEWVGSSRGLGYLMLNANARMQIDMMFAALIVIMAIALVLYFFVDLSLRVWISWDSQSLSREQRPFQQEF